MLLYHATSIDAAKSIVQHRKFATCQELERPDRGLFMHEDVKIARKLAARTGAIIVFHWPRKCVPHLDGMPDWDRLIADEVHALGRVAYTDTPARYVLPYSPGQAIWLTHVIVDDVAPTTWLSQIRRMRNLAEVARLVGDGMAITLV